MTVDQYLSRVSGHDREALERLRATIRSAVPEAEEAISSGVPAFRYKGRYLVSFGAAKAHLALYVMRGAALEALKADLGAYDTSNTVIRFTADSPVPDRLVRRIAEFRRAEMDAEA